MVTPRRRPGQASFSSGNMKRLIEARRANRLAEEARILAQEEEGRTIDPQTQIAVDAQRSLQESRGDQPPTPLDNPGFWGRLGRGTMNVLEKVNIPGEVSASFIRGAFDPSIRERAKEIREETPEEGLIDYLSASRKAYKEKDLPLWQTLPLEILGDPLTWVPIAAPLKAAKAAITAKKGAEIAKIAKSNRILVDHTEISKAVEESLESVASGKFARFTNKTNRFTGGALKWIVGKGSRKAVVNSKDPFEYGELILRSKEAKAEAAIATAVARLNTATSKADEVFKIGDDALLTVTVKSSKPGKPLIVEKLWTDIFETAFKRELKRGDVAKKSVKDLQKIAKYNMTDEQIEVIRRVYHSIDEAETMFDKAGVSLKKLYAKKDEMGKTIVQRYVPRQVVFREMGQAVTYNNAKRNIGSVPSNFKKRKFTTELEQELLDSIDAGLVQYDKTISGSMGAYFRSAYKVLRETDFANYLKANAGDRIKYTGNANERARVSRLLKTLRTKDGKAVIRKSTVKEIKKAFPKLAKIIEKGSTETGKSYRFEDIAKAFSKQADEALKETGLPIFRTKELRPPVEFKNLFFKNEKDARRVSKLLGTADSEGFMKLADASAESLGEVGDILRIGKTGFDFGFHLIQGLPLLGAAVFNPKLLGVWGKSVVNGFKSFAHPKQLETFIAQNVDMLDEAVPLGLEVGYKASDMYAGASGQIAKQLSRVKGMSKLKEQTIGRFEAQFIHSGDVLRIEGYKALRESALRTAGGDATSEAGQKALRELVSFLNKSTGSLNSLELGIRPTQRALERAFVFFSPRYTRACLALIKDAMMTGGVQGQQARRALYGMAGLGMGTYITISSLLDQEPDLDPRSSTFMSIKVNDDILGIGSFWRSFASFIVRQGDHALTPEDIMEQQRGSPLVSWLRGRGSPISGMGWDIFTGRDFLGRPLETPADIGKHLGRGMLPFWAEQAMIADPYRIGGAGTISEVFGMRTRPRNVWERRQSLRDELSQKDYNKQWNNLNDLQRNTLKKKYEEDLSVLDQTARDLANRTGTDLQEQVENYYSERDKYKERWLETVNEGIDLLESQTITPAVFRKIHLSDANTEKRVDIDRLNERKETGDLADVDEYFTTIAERYSDDERPEDIAVQEYFDTILDHNLWDEPLGYDYRKKEEAEQKFINKWGTETFQYVQQVLRSGQDLPSIVNEYYTARQKFEWFFEQSERAVLEAQPNVIEAENFRTAWIESKKQGKEKQFEEAYPEIKKINQKISRVQRILREQNKGLDGFLVRWGYYYNFAHPDNKVDSDTWQQSGALDPSVYDNGLSF